MRYFNTIATVFLVGVLFVSCKQETIQGDYFGQEFQVSGKASKTAAPFDQISEKDSLQTQMIGEIKEVCQAKGCWMTLDLGDDELIRVKFKDYGFFVPKDAAGKTAVIEGIAKKEVIDVSELKHLAEDAGKSQKEIDAITEPKEELTFVAKGVIIQ